MKTSLDCIPCFIRQALVGIRMLTDDKYLHETVVRQALTLISTMDFSKPPPQMGKELHRLLCTATGKSDPYREIKKRSNQFALGVYGKLNARVAASSDPFEAAVLLALAGNIIDFGTGTTVDEATVKDTIEKAFEQQLDKWALHDLKKAVQHSRSILYLADNAGEIVFDRLLIEALPRGKITFAVRGRPVINDATRSDAEEAGLTNLVTVLDNGSDIPGTDLASCSQEFIQRFTAADLIIAKGQGNYETLDGAENNIFFLFKVKCPVVALASGHGLGELVIKNRRIRR